MIYILRLGNASDIFISESSDRRNMNFATVLLNDRKIFVDLETAKHNSFTFWNKLLAKPKKMMQSHEFFNSSAKQSFYCSRRKKMNENFDQFSIEISLFIRNFNCWLNLIKNLRRIGSFHK